MLPILALIGCEPSDHGALGEVEKNIWFEDVAEDVGLNFTHWNGMSGETYFIEPVGAGGALVDMDGDGDLDVLLVQGQVIEVGRDQEVEYTFPRPTGRIRSRWFRNDLVVGANANELNLVEVTDDVGVSVNGYGMGVASGDFDNDGRIDLYVTHFGSNQLLRNVSENEEIRFADVTASAGADDSRWSTSATFVDVNGDGWLDLFIANYVDFRLTNHKQCRSADGRPNFCGPLSYGGQADRLLLNLGDGRFEDITASAGLIEMKSSGLGVVAADLDRDGQTDLYVANDLRRNFLWRNETTAEAVRFSESAMNSGSAVAMDGRAQASMGLVAGDVDNDGDDDLFMTHLMADTNTLYRNDGSGQFVDASSSSGLGAPSRPATGFGTVLIDADNDGWLDVMAANGGVRYLEAQLRSGDPYPLAQQNQFFHNRGDGTFADLSNEVGQALMLVEVGRGLAVGDVDNDGLSDVLLTNNSGPARLLMNRSSQTGNWLGLRLVDINGRDALGAEVTLINGNMKRTRRAATDGSYLTANDPRVLIGLGDAVDASSIQVRWPSGRLEAWNQLQANQYIELKEGTGAIF